jgi:hypothetical protein
MSESACLLRRSHAESHGVLQYRSDGGQLKPSASSSMSTLAPCVSSGAFAGAALLSMLDIAWTASRPNSWASADDGSATGCGAARHAAVAV